MGHFDLQITRRRPFYLLPVSLVGVAVQEIGYIPPRRVKSSNCIRSAGLGPARTCQPCPNQVESRVQRLARRSLFMLASTAYRKCQRNSWSTGSQEAGDILRQDKHPAICLVS